ncbi:hypothetical protein HYDPIDRAFT_38019 [Hydnomerulius pinastri MD-312]|nr:hypothetical protein HYDPIDRAFT_38019 [Hydnomerulius pinastri MD-312]
MPSIISSALIQSLTTQSPSPASPASSSVSSLAPSPTNAGPMPHRVNTAQLLHALLTAPNHAMPLDTLSGSSALPVEVNNPPDLTKQPELEHTKACGACGIVHPCTLLSTDGTSKKVAPPTSAPNPLPNAPPDPALAPAPSFLHDALPPSEPTSPAASPKTFNVVLFGETGVGQSSVINLIAGKPLAKVSPDADGCTMASVAYRVTLESWDFCIYDTVGLEQPDVGVNDYLAAIEQAFTLIRCVGAAGGVHLLLFCLRGNRITATVQSNYRLFYEVLCNKKVPIALVFTGLEREGNLEDWWVRNESKIKGYGVHSIGHACITAVKDGPFSREDKYVESQKKIRALLTEHAAGSSAFRMESEDWLTTFLKRFRESTLVHRRPGRPRIARTLVNRCGVDAGVAERIAELVTPGKPGKQAPASGSQAAR